MKKKMSAEVVSRYVSPPQFKSNTSQTFFQWNGLLRCMLFCTIAPASAVYLDDDLFI